MCMSLKAIPISSSQDTGLLKIGVDPILPSLFIIIRKPGVFDKCNVSEI